MGNISININASAHQHISTSTSWGSVYWQYFENLDKITAAETPLKLVKKLFLVHGELLPASTLAKLIEEEYHLPVTVAARGESFDLS